MPVIRDWEGFRERFPELAETVKGLGARIYEMGATLGAESEEFKSLYGVLQGAPDEALGLLGLPSPLDPAQALRAVFSLGGELLFNLEQGRQC